MEPFDLQKVNDTQYGQFVEMTAPDTAADWRPFLEAGYAELCKILAKRGLLPVGEVHWIEHPGNELYPGGTYAWRQSFAGKGTENER